ncbi:MAG: hypothetical protein AB1458_08215 [Bacteroidota bacterium]
MPNITPDFIPHEEFHKGNWLFSSARPYWYYFRRGKRNKAITYGNFLKSVDKPLRNLVRFLHGKGLATTPSCSGHCWSERDFNRIYEALERDSRDIRNGGLSLVDIETGERLRYRNKRYDLPWTRARFRRLMLTQQREGIIGIRTGRQRKLKEKLLGIRMKHAHVYEKDGIVFIHVTRDARGKSSKRWERITAAVKKAWDQG